MSPDTRQPRRATCLIVLLLLPPWTGGCISGSLASNTDRHPLGFRWSDAPRQLVHVGETVEFDFVLQDSWRQFVPPTGLADFCITTIGNEHVESEPDLGGHFRFAHTFDKVTPGDVIDVRTTAYQRRGQRDFMNIAGEWVYGENPYDDPDRNVADDHIQLTVYESPIELSIARPPDDLDLESGVLRIRLADGSTRSVYIDRPHRPGFTITGPEPDGFYTVRYRPSGNELNQTGTTEVEFVIHDMAGYPHYATVTLETP